MTRGKMVVLSAAWLALVLVFPAAAGGATWVWLTVMLGTTAFGYAGRGVWPFAVPTAFFSISLVYGLAVFDGGESDDSRAGVAFFVLVFWILAMVCVLAGLLVRVAVEVARAPRRGDLPGEG